MDNYYSVIIAGIASVSSILTYLLTASSQKRRSVREKELEIGRAHV
jgi:hypothetical protein